MDGDQEPLGQIFVDRKLRVGMVTKEAADEARQLGGRIKRPGVLPHYGPGGRRDLAIRRQRSCHVFPLVISRLRTYHRES